MKDPFELDYKEKDFKVPNPRGFTKKMKEAKLREQNSKCLMCGKKISLKEMKGDHIIPNSRGGNTHQHNHQGLCKKCHDKKTNEDRKIYGW